MNADVEFLRREKREILKAAELMEETLLQESLSRLDVIGLGTLLQNVYMGAERILRCLLLMKGSSIEKTERWHQAILHQAMREGFLSEVEFRAFLELLKFRHMHIHGYGHMLDEKRVRELASPVPRLIREYFDTHKNYFGGD
jgi:uncharacterized protein YutE (UPF0331/DUF86 family)